MKIHSNSFQLMDELLKEARHENPLFNSKEVENMIQNGRAVVAEAPKSFIHRIGVRTLMLTMGVLIVSLIAFTAIKLNKKDVASPDNTGTINRDISTPAVATKPMANALANNPDVTGNKTVSEVAPATGINKLNPSLENKKSVGKTSPKSESNLNANISSVKISESMHMVSRKGSAANDGTDKKEMTKEVAISFNYNDQKVRMKFLGEELNELSIDDQTVTAEKFNEHAILISEAKKLVRHKDDSHQTKQRTTDEESSNLNLVQFFNSQLHADNIVAEGMPYSFELTANQLLINNAALSAGQFQKYKKLYETKTGKMLTAGSEYAFEKGGKKN
jgi:hypothetical protein